jgi:hypothetical protein
MWPTPSILAMRGERADPIDRLLYGRLPSAEPRFTHVGKTAAEMNPVLLTRKTADPAKSCRWQSADEGEGGDQITP